MFWIFLSTHKSNYDNVWYKFSHINIVYIFITLTSIRVWDKNKKPSISRCQDPKRPNGKGSWKPQKFFLTSDITMCVLAMLTSRSKADTQNYLKWAPTLNEVETRKLCKSQTASSQFHWSCGRKQGIDSALWYQECRVNT